MKDNLLKLKFDNNVLVFDLNKKAKLLTQYNKLVEKKEGICLLFY